MSHLCSRDARTTGPRSAPSQRSPVVTTGKSGYEGMPGIKWQELCMSVLREHHPAPSFHVVPDDDRGDGGLEAYSDDGSAYQCYSPEQEPLSTPVRLKKQKGKMHADVGKFIQNIDTISGYLPSGLEIAHWVLLVPHINSRLLLTAAKEETDRLRAVAPPYAADDIIVSAHTLGDYEPAQMAVIRRQTQKLTLPDFQRLELADIPDERIDQMHTKLKTVPRYIDDLKRQEFVSRLLQNHTLSRALRDWILDQKSELGEDLERDLADLEHRLAVQYPLAHAEPTGMFYQVLTDTEQTVSKVLNAHDGNCRTMAEGQIAQWLMECPLDF